MTVMFFIGGAVGYFTSEPVMKMTFLFLGIGFLFITERSYKAHYKSIYFGEV